LKLARQKGAGCRGETKKAIKNASIRSKENLKRQMVAKKAGRKKTLKCSVEPDKTKVCRGGEPISTKQTGEKREKKKTPKYRGREEQLRSNAKVLKSKKEALGDEQLKRETGGKSVGTKRRGIMGEWGGQG